MEDGLVKVPSSGLSVDWVHWMGVSFMTVPGQERQREGENGEGNCI